MSSVFSEFPPEADPDLTASCERARPSEEARQRVEEVTGREEALCRVYSQAGDPRGGVSIQSHLRTIRVESISELTHLRSEEVGVFIL